MLPRNVFISLVFFFFVFVLIYTSFLAVPPTEAVLSSCSATVSPTTVSTSTSQQYTFTMGSVTGVLWIQITRPSSNFTITSASGSGWNTQVSMSTVTFTPIGQSAGSGTIYVTATSGSTEASSANWTVQASDDANGASPTTCTGTLGTAISGTPADTTGPTISNIVVSDVSQTSVKITWTTDESATSVVDYGTTDAYGTTSSDTTLRTSHSRSIDSLSANTTYHFKLSGVDSSGNTGETGDNSFVSSKASTTTTTTTTTTKTVTPTPTPKDTTAPTVTITTKLDKPFDEVPTIEGSATDPSGVSEIEYSIDGGKNFLPVDTIKNPGTKSTEFAFTPPIFEDGSYKIQVRTTDAQDNKGIAKTFTLVYDRLPPQVGSALFSVGPYILPWSEGGMIFALSGLKQRLTLSSIGGAQKIDVFIRSAAGVSQNVAPLVKNLDSGLWWQDLLFEKEGTYSLWTTSVDGAENTRERSLLNVAVLPKGKIITENGPVEGATITIYYFEPTTQQFVLWDAKPYGQTNPQTTHKDGTYQFLASPGKYYLHVKAPGFKPVKTTIFTLSSTLPINTTFTLTPVQTFIFPPLNFFLSFFQQEEKTISIAFPEVQEMQIKTITNTQFPFFIFKDGLSEVSSTQFRGKPTIFTFLTTWAPSTSEQIAILNDLNSQHKEINSAAVMTQEKASKVSIFKKKGGYGLPVLADPDGQLIEPLLLLTVPTHVFVDRKGVIQRVKVGVLTRDELLENLVN